MANAEKTQVNPGGTAADSGVGTGAAGINSDERH